MTQYTHTKTIKYRAQFIDQNCSITLEGMTFKYDGAFIITNKKSNKLGGLAYAYPNENKVGNWDGSLKINAHFGNEWHSNMGDKRQSVYFTHEAILFYGVY